MKYFWGTPRKSPLEQPGVGTKERRSESLGCILRTTTRADHPPTSQLLEERSLLQLLAKRKVQALQAQGVVSLEVLLANKEPEGRSGREQSIVTETEAPRGSRLLLTDKHVRDGEWSREYQRAVCGATWPGSQFLYITHGAAWVSSNGPTLALHTFAWHMKAMVGLFHVAMDDSGARMIETIFWSGHQKNGLFVFALRWGEIERPDYGPENQNMVF